MGMSEKSWIERIPPRIDKGWYYLIFGISWSAVGIYLNYLALTWLIAMQFIEIAIISTFAQLVAFGGYELLFHRLTCKRIMRIRNLPQRGNILAFQSVGSYVMIIGMITLGRILRQTTLPMQYLAIIYMDMGTILFLSSILFYRTYIALKKTPDDIPDYGCSKLLSPSVSE